MTARLTPNSWCSPMRKPPVQPGCRMHRSSSIATSSLRRTRVIPRLSRRRSLRLYVASDGLGAIHPGQVGQSGPIRCAKTRTLQRVVRPPVAWILALVVGVAADRFYPLRFVPASVPGAWVGGAIFAIAFALAIWAIVTIRKAGTRVETYKPTTAIVIDGTYSFTRNPIYLGMVLCMIGVAVAFDSLWILATLVVFYLVIRYGVIVREEAYLERKFGDVYLGYKSRVRRWL